MKQLSSIFASTEKSIWLSRGFVMSALFAILLAIPMVASAQSTTATIVGTVSDPGGAQVPNASVTARNADTGLTRTVTSGEDGNYRIEFLPVGNYSIEVKAATGFKKAFRTGIVLRIGDTASVDMPLEVGAVNEEVTVTTAPPEVNTNRAELGRTVQSREIENLPLVERNIFALLDLTPGVQSNNSGVATASAATSNLSLGFPEQRTIINGGVDGGSGSVNYYLDGGINMTNLRNTGNVTPNPDAIQEFRVQTNSYNAEYGRFASGIINVLTKSGTNKFRGSLYEFVRNDVFNANEWGASLEKAPYKRNQFGGTIGGPIKSDKTFFFFSYSGLRQITSTFLSGAIVPTAAERAGDFRLSSTIPKDPSTGVLPNRTVASMAVVSCLGVTGVICANRIDPVAAKIVNDYIPLPNVVVPGRGLVGWQGNVANPFNTNEFLIKLDHQLNEPHRLTFSYFTTAGKTTVFPAAAGNLPWATQDYQWRQHNANLSDVWVIGPDKVNQLWITFSRNFGGRLNVPDTSLRDLGSSFVPQGAPSLPDISVGGYFRLVNAIGGPTAGTNFYSIRDVLSWNRGRHSIKVGGEVSLNKDVQDTLLNNYGVFSFNNTATGNGFGDFLFGIPNAISQDAPVRAYTNTWYTALFVQDDFRVHQRVTLNLGLRWDVQSTPTDPENRVANYIPGKQSVVRPTAPVGLQFFGDEGVERGGIPTSYSHFSPRFGVAWDPFGNGKTSIRAAAGLFYGSISGNVWNTQTNTQPFSIRLNFTNTNRLASTTTQLPLGASLSNPYSAFVGGTPFPYTGAFVTGGGAFAVATDFEWPLTVQTNVSVQRQITKDLTLGVAYVGTTSTQLPFGRDANYPILNATATSAAANILARRPNPLLGQVLILDSDQEASYHGLQVTGAMRFSEKFTLNGYYTFSKTLSSVQLHNNTTQGLAQNYTRLDLDKGRADTDQRHVFSMSMNFQPDYYSGENRILRAILNGWSISPIIKARSGRPFTVANGVDANLDGVATDRAQLIGDPRIDNPTPDRWFNIAAFARNPNTVVGVAFEGNSPRDFLDGPGYQAVDLGLSRDFRIRERFKLRLRAEGTNILNHANLDQPNATAPVNPASPGNFGRILGAGPMRKIQFGARLTF